MQRQKPMATAVAGNGGRTCAVKILNTTDDDGRVVDGVDLDAEELARELRTGVSESAKLRSVAVERSTCLARP